jgi:hypothetical protein
VASRRGADGQAWRSFTFSSLAGLILWSFLGLHQAPALLAYHEDESPDLPRPGDEEQQMLSFIEAVTTPEDCIITDDMPLLYWSGRMTPPELAEMSGNRLISGELTVAELIAISERYDCPVIAAVDHRIVDYLPEYFYWVASNYLGRVYYQEVPLFFAKAHADPQPATRLQANFADKIALPAPSRRCLWRECPYFRAATGISISLCARTQVFWKNLGSFSLMGPSSHLHLGFQHCS